MKLLSYFAQGRPGWGAAVDGGVFDLGRRLPALASVRELLAGGQDALSSARDMLARAPSPDHALADLVLRPPVPLPGKIFCIGVNYAHRNDEYRDGSDAPQHPSVFMRVPESLVGHGQPLLRPPESVQLDYEGEIGIVIGAPGRRIAREAATRHIAGLTCVNEGTLRDWVRHGKFNVTQGKNFSASGAIGPWLVTAHEFTAGYGALRVQTRVNGEQRQDDTTAHLMFDFAHLIAYLSSFTTLEPGDVIATGTPTGAGARFDPPRWLRPGDVVEVEVSGVGILRNRVQDEAPAAGA
jgi:5-carboxymethyl-2-hydroxymuconate isomerase